MSSALQARQAALQESELRYRTLFERVPVGLFRSTPAGRFLDTNQAFLHILGYVDRESLFVVSVNDLYVAPDDRTRWQADLRRDGLVRDFETQMRRSDGRVVWVRINCRDVRDSDGTALFYEGSIEDVTSAKKAEEEISELTRGLERRVVERTAQLEAANRELEAFVYSVSHDLRAPLRSIDGFSRILLEDYVDRLDTEGKRLPESCESRRAAHGLR